MSDLIPADDLAAPLKTVPEWELEDRAITRTLRFGSFAEAIDFVNDLAEIAEVANHHPDIDIRYSRVTLRLTTHDRGGLTRADFEMARRIDNLAG